ncbi:hypothetical protein DPMN_059486 [Dreissena polymorpha]|uniref:Uncharacterized protein n=1 Tax=Dreissena polymorpha TaxID=45954 RepID=A0A9D4C3K7_DREPO|nr:hypothetical protein DPMN_059486 [Dreissena polymorpha]
MEFTHPELYRRYFHCSMDCRDRPGWFCSVAGDMKVERTIQRVSKGPGGHYVVGVTRNASAVAEFELLFHEIGSITSHLNLLTTNNPMDQTECHLQHSLSATRRHSFNYNVEILLDYVLERQNPYTVTVNVPVPLHNLLTKLAVDKEAILKERKAPLSNDMANAQKSMDIAKERVMSLKQILSHDLISSSPLFDGDPPVHVNKSKLIGETESLLPTHIIADFMSKMRHMPLAQFSTLGGAIDAFINSASSICEGPEYIHLVLDSCVEMSLKEVVSDNEALPAIKFGNEVIPELFNWIEEADSRVMAQKRRMLPLHQAISRLGTSLAKTMIKSHILTGDDCMSKVGIKHASVTSDPSRMKHEQKNRQTAETFDLLDLIASLLQAMAPVIHGGWEEHLGMLLATKHMKPLPWSLLLLCKCT